MQTDNGPTTAPERGGWTTIEELCDRHLGGQPSAAALQLLKTTEQARAEVRDFTERAFKLMALSRFDPKDISPSMARAQGVMFPGILPGAWGGMVPPITLEGRHKGIDPYLRSNPWASLGAGTVMLDVGCGFPPRTSMDAAAAFPDWQIVGADPAFDQYLLYDEGGNYACLDPYGRVRYFQAGVLTREAWLALFVDPAGTTRRFSEAFGRLLPKLPADDGRFSTAEHDGNRLVRHPLQTYERSNLRFIQAGLGSPDVPQAGVVRCFNVLPYFDADFRRKAEEWVAQVLRPGGLFLCGGDGPATLDARYSVYRNEGGRLVEKEFAFALETVRPLGWLALHDGERETWRLAELVAILRSDEQFLRGYNARLDALLEENRIAVRDDSGYLAAAREPIDPAQEWPANVAIARQMGAEFGDRAVSVLRRAGFNAWRNQAGHIAVGSEAPV